MFASAPQSLPRLVEVGRFAHHQLSRAHADIGSRDRKLDALVLPDRPAEDHALARIGRRFVDKPFGVADAFGSDQNALGVHAGKNVAKALAFCADEILGRHPHVLEKHLGGRVIHHGADGPDGEPVALGLAHVEEKHRQSRGARFRFRPRRGPRQQQHEIGMLGARRPNLLAVDDVIIPVARVAVVRRLSVSVPESGSVTPNACSRSLPRAMAGR